MAQFEESQQGGQQENKRFGWVKQIIGIIAVVAVIAAVFGLRSGKSTMKLSASEDGIEMNYEDFSLAIVYDEIEDIELREEFDFGTCIAGGEIGDYQYGEYENTELGTYTLGITSKSDCYLVIKRSDDSYAVFNWSGTKDTEALYEAILEMLNEE